MWKTFQNEGEDFLNAGVWDGDYGELIRVLAPFNDRVLGARLLPGLSRADSFGSVATALIVAAVDVLRAPVAPLNAQELAEAIKERGDREYALPRGSRGADDVAAQIATLIQTVPFARWRYLVGPVLSKPSENPCPASHRIFMEGNAIVVAVLP